MKCALFEYCPLLARFRPDASMAKTRAHRNIGRWNLFPLWIRRDLFRRHDSKRRFTPRHILYTVIELRDRAISVLSRFAMHRDYTFTNSRSQRCILYCEEWKRYQGASEPSKSSIMYASIPPSLPPCCALANCQSPLLRRVPFLRTFVSIFHSCDRDCVTQQIP